MTAPRQSRAPALAAAALLHAGMLALVLFVPGRAPQPIGSSVPINIVSSAPFTDTRPAVQAPQTQAAQAPQPVPAAKPQPPAPVPAPAPAFTETRPQPVKAERPTPAQTPSLKPAQPAAKPFDFDRLQQIIANARHNEGAPASSAQRGPARPETAPQARPDAGQGISQSDLAGLQQLLERLWTMQCEMEGISSVKPFKVHFTVTLTGHLLGPPDAGGLQNSSNPLVASVARRAIAAVHEAEPFAEPYYGQTITVNFDPKKAYASKCSN